MLRLTSVVVVIGSINLLYKKRKSPSSLYSFCTPTLAAIGDKPWPFDTKGMPMSIVTKYPIQSKPLILTGVGMRRKNLFVVEVDIYLIGMNFSSSALQQAKRWSKSHSHDKTLSKTLMENLNPNSNEVKISASLKFVREISKSTLIEAFNSAFEGCSTTSIDTFKSLLSECIDHTGVKVGDEINYYWFENGDLVVYVNDKSSRRVRSEEINLRLLEVYIDPSRTISKELSTCVERHLLEIPEL
eukprot:gene6553-9002_t